MGKKKTYKDRFNDIPQYEMLTEAGIEIVYMN